MVGDFFSDFASSFKFMSYVRIDVIFTGCEFDIFIIKICRVSDIEVWIKGFKEDEIKLFNKRGKFLKILVIRFICYDFSIIKSGFLLIVDFKLRWV